MSSFHWKLKKGSVVILPYMLVSFFSGVQFPYVYVAPISTKKAIAEATPVCRKNILLGTVDFN
jgi:hypothetical protein